MTTKNMKTNLNKITEVLKVTRGKNAKIVMGGLHHLTEKQVETYAGDYYIKYPRSLVSGLKSTIERNIKTDKEEKEKAEAFQKKYGKTIDLFQPILKLHREELTKMVKEKMADNKEKYKENYKKKLLKQEEESKKYSWYDPAPKYNEAKFNKMYAELVKTTIELSIRENEMKLLNAIHEYTGTLLVKKVEKVYSRFGVKGIEGMYKLTLEDGTVGDMSTMSIGAGGYNIQCFHYRYIIHMDECLVVKQDKTLDISDKELEVIKVLTDNIEEFVEDTEHGYRSPVMMVPRKIKFKVEEIKGASRNWSPLVKKNLIYKSEFGNYAFKRYNYFIPKKSWEMFQTLKGDQ